MIYCIKCRFASEHTICDACVKRLTKPLKPEQAKAVRKAMEEDNASLFYLFHDGTVMSEPALQRQMTSRTAQLVAIATKGFPQCVGRRFMDIVHPKGD